MRKVKLHKEILQITAVFFYHILCSGSSTIKIVQQNVRNYAFLWKIL